MGGYCARLLCGLLALCPGAATACALELILAMDVSGSINAHEHRLQTEGLASAFEHPSLAAAVSGLEGGMLVTVTQWSGASRQTQSIGWRKVSAPEDLMGFAAEIRAANRRWRNFSTAIGEALLHAEFVSRSAPEICLRRVIDVSGDGVSNEGVPPQPEAWRLAQLGYTINGLVIRGADPDPVAHYNSQVIAGPGAFVEVAESFEDYPRAILRKLLREIESPMMVSQAPAGK